MTHFEDEILLEAGASDDQKAARLNAFEIWFGRFSSAMAQACPAKAIKIKWEDDCAQQINNDYWELMYERVKPKIIPKPGKDKRADRHKIAALAELLINWHQPIIVPEADQRRKFNAQLAYYCALNIIGNWNHANLTDLHISDSFATEHISLLMALPDSSDSLPIFTNAATWYLVETIFLARKNKIIP